jgi:hypothetical protein
VCGPAGPSLLALSTSFSGLPCPGGSAAAATPAPKAAKPEVAVEAEAETPVTEGKKEKKKKVGRWSGLDPCLARTRRVVQPCVRAMGGACAAELDGPWRHS